MSTQTRFPDTLNLLQAQAGAYRPLPVTAQRPATPDTLAASMTRAASKQTYATIRLLADRDRSQDALRAYAYFRWVDDRIDDPNAALDDRIRFLSRQQMLMDSACVGMPRPDVTAEELDMLAGDKDATSGLRAYLKHMMAVMAFDLERRGALVSTAELTAYSHALAVAVTELLHHCIGHDQPTPPSADRYRAVTGAHITHMLRDTLEDMEAGYFNIAREFVEARGLAPDDVQSEAYREWAKERVALARQHFAAGRAELARVRNWRCRLAGAAYIARFETVLEAIERDDYRLRREYNERKTPRGLLRMAWSTLKTCAGWVR